MRNLTLACASLALMSGVVSVNLWRELDEERALNAQLLSRLAEHEGRSAPAPSARPSARMAFTSPPPGQQVAEPARSAEERNADAERADREFSEKRLAQLNDPEYRRSLMLMSARTNPGLVVKLNLSAAEATRLYEILADAEISARRATLDSRDMSDDAAREAVENAVGELNRKRDEALLALLGNARLAQYGEYRQERGGWQQLTELNQTLAALGQPLNGDQSRSLATTLIAEQKKLLELRQKSAMSPTDPSTAARFQELLVQHQAESRDRILVAATNHLTSTQLDALRDTLQQQLEQARRTADAMARSAAASRQ